MSGKPRLLNTSTQAEPSGKFTPEEEELNRKRAELSEIESKLADRELELANLSGELLAFERRYMQKVGRLYAELDDLDAQIAEARFRRQPNNAGARQKAENAKAQARESAKAVDDAGPETKSRSFEPTESLKKLFRRAARKLHPDLATDPQEKARRQKVMVEINSAYEECDEARMQRILDEWQISPDQVEGEDTVAKLVRAIRTIALVKKRLVAIKDEIEALMQNELSQLKLQVEEAAAAGRDLLVEMAGRVVEKVEEAKTELESLRSSQTFHE